MRKLRSALGFFNYLKEQDKISENFVRKMRCTKNRRKPEKNYQNMKPQLKIGLIINFTEK